MIYLFLILLVAAVIVMSKASGLPNTFEVSRSTFIKAPPEKIFPLIDDLTGQGSWSPFEKDPAMVKTFGGPSRGVGAFMTWRGNRQVGAGRLTILESTPFSLVVLRLEMSKPMKADNIVTFDLAPVEGGTQVTWSMEGPQPILGKIVNIVINCEKMVGADFALGLARLKEIAERP